MIEFTPEQLKAFEKARENELAKNCWERCRDLYPQISSRVGPDDKQGIAFMKQALDKGKKYLAGHENDKDYMQWWVKFTELAFLAGDIRFDEHPWTASILNEVLWHPYQRIDVLLGLVSAGLEEPNNLAFFEKLGELT